MANRIVWCDIPVVDLDRAIRFYSAVLGAEVKKESFPEMAIGMLPHGSEEVGACLFTSDNEAPGREGPLVYLNVEERMDDALSAVEKNGGKVLKRKHQIGQYGFRAVILDSEGNRIALHSPE